MSACGDSTPPKTDTPVSDITDTDATPDMNPADMDPADMGSADMDPADMGSADMDPADMDSGDGTGADDGPDTTGDMQEVPPAPLEFGAVFALSSAGSIGGDGAPVETKAVPTAAGAFVVAVLPPGPVKQGGVEVPVSGGDVGKPRLAFFDTTGFNGSLANGRAIDLEPGETLEAVQACGTERFAVTRDSQGLRVIAPGPTGGLAVATLSESPASASVNIKRVKILRKQYSDYKPDGGDVREEYVRSCLQASLVLQHTGDVILDGPNGATGKAFGVGGGATGGGATGGGGGTVISSVPVAALFGNGPIPVTPVVRGGTLVASDFTSDGLVFAVQGPANIGESMVAANTVAFGRQAGASVDILGQTSSFGQDVESHKLRVAEFGDGLVALGELRGTVDFGGGVSVSAPGSIGGGPQMFIAVLDKNGSPRIGRKGGGMSIDRVIGTSDGEIVLAGTHALASEDLALTAPVGLRDAFVAVLDGATLAPRRATSFGAQGATTSLLALAHAHEEGQVALSRVAFAHEDASGKSQLGFGGLDGDGKRGFTAPALVLTGTVPAVAFERDDDVLLGLQIATTLEDLYAIPGEEPFAPWPPILNWRDAAGYSRARVMRNSR
jgi:hypothetical protein